ncbi:MAG: hypothetical protein WAT35_00770 [Tabrizicola sp.]|jgi:Ca2+-binding RTX toxin-like protein|uniref:calcium-binding protein n=1 Tax=Tabrizicola sp. TaxID=2005166 RepID=UPI003BAF8481
MGGVLQSGSLGVCTKSTFNEGSGNVSQSCGGNENNSMSGSASDDTLSSGGGNDTTFGGSGNDSLLGGGHNNVHYVDRNNYVPNGGAGVDLLYGGSGDDNLNSGEGSAIGIEPLGDVDFH